MSHLRVQVLGGLNVFRRGGEALSIAGSCRPILGYLLTHRQRPVSRMELAETLWADHDGDHARRCLSTALWRLKKTTARGPPLLTFQGADEVSFNWHAPAWVDAVAMETRVQPLLRLNPGTLASDAIGRLQRGVRLYRGDYLIGIDEDWALLERQRLRNVYVDGLYHLVLAYAAGAAWAAVIQWGRRLSQEEPLREDVHRLLMRAYAKAGNRATAIAQYQLCRRVIHDDLGIEPMEETQELYRELTAAAPRAGAVTPASNPALMDAARRVGRVRRALASSQRQLDRVLASLPQGEKPNPAQ
jgi:DNA-binding SARP family transcriptional activator